MRTCWLIISLHLTTITVIGKLVVILETKVIIKRDLRQNVQKVIHLAPPVWIVKGIGRAKEDIDLAQDLQEEEGGGQDLVQTQEIVNDIIMRF